MAMKNITLILLVGTNPLPNLVVARYLLGQFDHQISISTIYLICSESNNKQKGTKEYAENLKRLLEDTNIKLKRLLKDTNIKIELIPLSDVGNPESILAYLNNYPSWDEKSKYHLNYTGGTKTMSVHIHAFFKNKFRDIEFSYLDARTYTLKYDDGTYYPANGDLRNYVKVTIEELLKLHGYEIKPDSFKNTTFDNVLDKFKKAIQEGSYREFIDWYKDIRYIKSENNFKKTKDFIENLKREFPINLKMIAEKFGDGIPQIAKEILDAFPDENQIHFIENGEYKLWVPDQNKFKENFKNRVKNTWEYIDGKWLEHYVYDGLCKILQEKGLEEKKQYGWSLKSRNRENKEFELDIFVINGYQLIAISITTDDQKYIKPKGFEVIHRSRQIGGDESTAILITALEKDKAIELQKDLHINTGTSEERFKVFGIEDWKDINDKILNFLDI